MCRLCSESNLETLIGQEVASSDGEGRGGDQTTNPKISGLSQMDLVSRRSLLAPLLT